MLVAVWGCCIQYGDVYADNLGVIGRVYEIQEPDALVWIEKKLKELEASGDIDRQQQTLNNQARASLERPNRVSGLHLTKTPRTIERDLTVLVPRDIKGPFGEMIQKAGTRINPLAKIFSKKALIFLDGDDSAQLQWALEQHSKHRGLVKLVLVNGSPLALMKRYEVPFYFDQGGRLSRYFRLEQIPAKVYQKKDKLIIDEVKL